MSEPTARPSLRRSLGVVDVAGLGFNAVIGSGIFLLPGKVAVHLGPAAIMATLVAGIMALLIALCFAEVGSRFQQTGGPYVYAREAYGSFVGFEVGWVVCLLGAVAWAAITNGFAIALSYFFPVLAEPTPQRLTILALLLGLGIANLLGAKFGAWLSNIATWAKILALLAFVALGLSHVRGERFDPFAPLGFDSLGQAVLLILYAYVGFENLVVPAGEMRRPQRAVPLALLLVMGTATILYLLVQTVVTGTLDQPAGLDNAVAASAEAFLGPSGGALIAAGIVLSIFGVNASSALVGPRRFYALAEQREVPAWMAKVHPKTGVPWTALLVCYVLTAVLALSGSFVELVKISVVGRMLQYIPTCLAVLVFRRRLGPAPFRLPLGPVIPILAIALCLWLLSEAKMPQLLAGLAAVASGVPFYLWSRRNRAS